MRGGAGTAVVDNPENIARALAQYREAGVEIFILSGYPHLEEAYRPADLLFPAIGKKQPHFQTVQKSVEAAKARAGSATVGRFGSNLTDAGTMLNCREIFFKQLIIV